MKDGFIACVGVWGCGCPVDTSAAGRSTDRAGRRDQRHYDYLKKKSPTVINVMRMKGTLEQYLTDLNRDTQETFDLLIRQYAEIEGVTEDLKRSDQMEWVRRMNSIRSRVEEFVCSGVIYA